MTADGCGLCHGECACLGAVADLVRHTDGHSTTTSGTSVIVDLGEATTPRSEVCGGSGGT